MSTSPTTSDNHHFSKPGEQRGYATLTNAERWQWHAHTYAWRRVYLNVADTERTSPCDPNGEWFDAGMVDRETTRLRADKARHDGARQPFTFTDQELAERAEWARLKGYEHWNAYLDAVQRGDERITGFLGWSRAQRDTGPARVGTFERLGVTVTEHQPAAE